MVLDLLISCYKKSFLDYTDLFSHNDYENNDKIIQKYVHWDLNKMNVIAMFAINTENVRKLKYCIYFLKKYFNWNIKNSWIN